MTSLSERADPTSLKLLPREEKHESSGELRELATMLTCNIYMCRQLSVYAGYADKQQNWERNNDDELILVVWWGVPVCEGQRVLRRLLTGVWVWSRGTDFVCAVNVFHRRRHRHQRWRELSCWRLLGGTKIHLLLPDHWNIVILLILLVLIKVQTGETQHLKYYGLF